MNIKAQRILNKHLNSVKVADSNTHIINAMKEFAEEYHKEQLRLGAVNTMLPSIDSSTFKNYLEAKGYAETLNPLVYKKQGFEYDKEILHRHFLNEIEFGN